MFLEIGATNGPEFCDVGRKPFEPIAKLVARPRPLCLQREEIDKVDESFNRSRRCRRERDLFVADIAIETAKRRLDQIVGWPRERGRLARILE